MTKAEALSYLYYRRKFFLDKKLFGRAETMKEMYDIVEKKDETDDFSDIKTVGLYIEINPITYETI